METLYQILGLLSAVLIAWFLCRQVKGQPQLFSRDKMGQSFFTMGVLALVLIGFIGFLVLLLRAG